MSMLINYYGGFITNLWLFLCKTQKIILEYLPSYKTFTKETLNMMLTKIIYFKAFNLLCFGIFNQEGLPLRKIKSKSL